MPNGDHVPGLELNRRFYRDVVAPIVAPVAHAAALLGWGSDVLGFDTARSTDHGWGPRLQVFVTGADVEPVRALVDARLPDRFEGWPVRYGWNGRPVEHHVDVLTLGTWLLGQLGLDPRDGLSAHDWLSLPQQLLLGVTRGAVYADLDGELARVRALLAWYPRDVWLWMLACQWRRIAQEEAFLGRTAEVGDELGSRLVAARLARDLVRLALLQARQYQPYTKWLGTEFARLDDPDGLGEALVGALTAADAASREASLAAAAERVAERHNRLGVTRPVDPSTRPFHGRPFQVLMADRFVDACLAAVGDERLRGRPLTGSVDQFVDSTDVLSAPERARALRGFLA